MSSLVSFGRKLLNENTNIGKRNSDEKVQNQYDTNHIGTEVIVWLHTFVDVSLD